MNERKIRGNLFLFPASLGTEPVSHVLPPHHRNILKNVDLFFVENLRSARRYLKKIDPSVNIDRLEFKILDKNTTSDELVPYILRIESGRDAAIISEAGLPCIADPGSKLVRIAQEAGLKIIPLPGPSSILQGLMASGMTGQRFMFHGYLPIRKKERADAIKELERRAHHDDATQIFMETPYRNVDMFRSVLQNGKNDTYLCIACNIMQADEWIKTRTIGEWQHEKKPDIHKKPAVFLIYRHRD